MRLGIVTSEAPFPLYAIDPRHWSGDVFVGDVDRLDGARVVAVSVVYTDDDAGRAATVSNIDASLRVQDALDRHLIGFVSRFEPRFVTRRTRPRRRVRFPSADFSRETLLVQTSIGDLGAELLRHRLLPLQLVRLAPVRGTAVTDVAVAAWETTARDLAPLIECVDARLAGSFDAAAAGEDYPPPGWEAPGTLGEP